ncbi:unnamed protein product [Blepharisma stoltei]|uniref:Uncharacterized protein n=1 Tax=Blepharisma stoltei TaxID=1481888 RepID=A0AAU9JRV4_9CILI|nr:unnamed protein product [Blepharisma stoltei]
MISPSNVTEIYQQIIDECITCMRPGFLGSGRQENTLQRIKDAWSNNLFRGFKPINVTSNELSQYFQNKPASSDQDYYTVPYEKKAKIEVIEEKKIPQVIETPPSSPSSDSEEDEEEEEELERDPLADEFANRKKQIEEAQQEEKLKQTKEVREVAYSDDEGETISDEETNTNPPEVNDYLFCLYEKVHRKGNNWKLRLDKCVLQIGGSKELIYRSATGELDFKKGNGR